MININEENTTIHGKKNENSIICASLNQTVSNMNIILGD